MSEEKEKAPYIIEDVLWGATDLDMGDTVKTILSALKDAGFVIVPREPTNTMLEYSGTIQGWDADAGDADLHHYMWWKTMIAAYEAESDT